MVGEHRERLIFYRMARGNLSYVVTPEQKWYEMRKQAL